MKFQDDISNMNTYIHTYIHTYGQAETNMPPHFFKVGGIIKVMILSFRTDRSGQTVQTQIRPLLQEQSDQDLHCLFFHLHLHVTPSGVAPLYEF